MPLLKVKAEMRHAPRNDVTVSDVEDRIMRYLNHPEQEVVDIRIAVGRAAGAFFLTLAPGRKAESTINRLVRSAGRELEHARYADHVKVDRWYIQAIEQEDE